MIERLIGIQASGVYTLTTAKYILLYASMYDKNGWALATMSKPSHWLLSE